jgi:hypothetical protein
MHWETGRVFAPRTVHLYLRVGCSVSVPIVVKTQNEDIPKFKTVEVNDRVNYWGWFLGKMLGRSEWGT